MPNSVTPVPLTYEEEAVLIKARSILANGTIPVHETVSKTLPVREMVTYLQSIAEDIPEWGEVGIYVERSYFRPPSAEELAFANAAEALFGGRQSHYAYHDELPPVSSQSRLLEPNGMVQWRTPRPLTFPALMPHTGGRMLTIPEATVQSPLETSGTVTLADPSV